MNHGLKCCLGILFGGLVLSFGVGCARSSSPQSTQPVVVEEPDVEHTVRYSGETLAVIARWYTGRATNWAAIRDANPGLRPERINLGQIIMIPRALVVEERPMPKDFVKSTTSAKSVDKGIDSEPSPVSSVGATSDDAQSVGSTVSAAQSSAESMPTAAAHSEPTLEPTTSEPVVEASSSSSAAPAVTDDKEREKLLDELLQQ